MDSDNEHIICSIETLNSKPKSSYTCHICSTVVKTNANLKAHLIKTHQIIESPADEAFYSKKKCKIRNIYHCPIENCKYNIRTGKGVNKFSILKQHYNWVHMPHAFLCLSCNKSFGTAPALKYHQKNCGQRFTCSICNSDFAEEKFLTYHQNHIHFKRPKNSNQSTGTSSSCDQINGTSEPVKVLQPIYIPMIFPIEISDTAVINSMKESTMSNMEFLNKLRVFKPETKNAETQVNMINISQYGELKPICNAMISQNMIPYPPQILTSNTSHPVNCISSYNWQIDSGNCHQFYANSSRDYLNSCNASMQTVPYNSYDNFFNVETQTNLAGFVGARDIDISGYENISLNNDDLISSLFNDVGCSKPETDEDLLRLADNHTQTGPCPIDFNLGYLNDIETQTNFQDFDDLLYTN